MYIYLPYRGIYLSVARGLGSRQALLSPRWGVGCHTNSPHRLFGNPGKPQGCLQLISAVSLRTAGPQRRVSGSPGAAVAQKTTFPLSAPGATEHSAPRGLHLWCPGFADGTFQSHLELYWCFFCIVMPLRGGWYEKPGSSARSWPVPLCCWAHSGAELLLWLLLVVLFLCLQGLSCSPPVLHH